MVGDPGGPDDMRGQCAKLSYDSFSSGNHGVICYRNHPSPGELPQWMADPY